MISSRAVMYPLEQARLRELIKAYQHIGFAGAFGAMSIERVLVDADKAAASGDASAMVAAYERMLGCK